MTFLFGVEPELPRLLKRVVKTANPAIAKARILRDVKASLNGPWPGTSLELPGRPTGSAKSAIKPSDVNFSKPQERFTIAPINLTPPIHKQFTHMVIHRFCGQPSFESFFAQARPIRTIGIHFLGQVPAPTP